MSAATCALCSAHTTDRLCRQCIRRTTATARHIAQLVDDLEDTVTRQTRTGPGGHIPKGHERPLPFATGPGLDTAHANLRALIAWAGHVTGRDIHAHGDVETRDAARHAARQLADSASWFRVADDAAHGATVLAAIRASLRIAVDRAPVRIPSGPCGAHVDALQLVQGDTDDALLPVIVPVVCDRTLRAEPGNPIVECRACGTQHTAGARNAYQLDALSRMTVTRDQLADVAAALPTLIGRTFDPGTLRVWIHRRRLRPVVSLVKGDTTIRYRAQHLLDLARDTTARPGPARRDRERTSA